MNKSLRTIALTGTLSLLAGLVCVAQTQDREISVSADGKADFATIQEAVNSVLASGGRDPHCARNL
jgi:pectin methylesterase-like acyl-CoA thioesterase